MSDDESANGNSSKKSGQKSYEALAEATVGSGQMTIRTLGFVVLYLVTLSTAAGISNRSFQDAGSPRNNLADALAQQSFDEAVVIAKARLARALDAGKRHQLETSGLYIDLANAQRLNADPQAAQTNYEAAVDLIESHADMLNIALEKPLTGLGQAMLDQNRPDLAVSPLERAVHVRQVNDGPHDSLQIDALRALATAFVRLGDFRQAGLTADRIGYLVTRNRTGADLDAVQAAVNLGSIYRDLKRYEDERSTYREAIEFAKASTRFPDSSQVEPYVRIAESFSQEYFEMYFGASEADELPGEELLDEAKTFHQQAVKIARQSDSNWQHEYRAQLALGDFYTLTDNFAGARRAYRDSWQLLTVDPARHARRRKDLESVVPLLQPEPQIRHVLDAGAADRHDGGPAGHVTTTFTVTRRGRLADIGLVEITPARDARIEAGMKTGLARFVYRPRMQGGFIVPTPNQQYRFEYSRPVPKTARD